MIRTQNTAMLSPAEVARELGVTCETLRRWRRDGRGPAAIRLGTRVVRYDPAAVRAWIKMQAAA